MRVCYSVIIFSFFFISGCKDAPVEQDRCDKKVMLQNYAERLIIPAFAKVHAEVLALKNAWNSFKINPTSGAVSGLQTQWTASYRAWQNTNAYNFGPAGEAGLKLSLLEEIGTFPADINKMETFITAQDFSLNNAFRNTRGFLALEYLLFHQSDLLVSEVSRRNYCEAVLQHLELELATVNGNWKTYKDQFVADGGTDAGSALSVLYNEFLRSFEELKNRKVATPIGITNFFMIPAPQSVEAYYSGQSLEFLKLHLQAIENIYEGRSADGADGMGLKDYLDCVEGGPALISLIDNSLKDIHLALDAIPADQPMSELVEQDLSTLLVFYNTLKSHVHLFGSDMSSVLGIAITFDSGDGD